MILLSRGKTETVEITLDNHNQWWDPRIMEFNLMSLYVEAESVSSEASGCQVDIQVSRDKSKATVYIGAKDKIIWFSTYGKLTPDIIRERIGEIVNESK